MADINFLKICSFNASGLRVKEKLNTLLDYFKQINADVTFLQETHLVQDDRDYINKVWGDGYHLYGNSKNSKGLITLFNKKIKTENIKLIASSDRYIISYINIGGGKKLILVNIYAPNDNREKIYFFNNISCEIRKAMLNKNDHSIICGGDFNTVHDNDLDIISGEKHNIDVVNRFKKLLNENLLIDTWRQFNESEKMYTWRRGFISRRLDYILVGEDIIQYVQGATINSIGFSDHLLVSVTIKFNSFRYGKSYYKMNISVLQDKQYVDMMKNKIPILIKDNDNLDPHLQWEMVKKEIKEITIKFCKKRAQEKGEEKMEIKKNLEMIERQIVFSPDDQELNSKQIELRNKWEKCLIEETRGRQIRSGIKWIEEGEKCSKYFLSLEKTRAANNTIF